MNKLIKLSDTHYIVVDDTTPTPGNFVYSNVTKTIVIFTDPRHFSDGTYKRITHSTQPLEIEPIPDEKIPKVFDEIKQLSLSEVEEINGYSVGNRMFGAALQYALDNCQDNISSLTKLKLAWENGFKAHQELVKDKLFTIEDLRRAFDAGNEGSGGSLRNRVRKYNGFDEYITNELGYVWDEDNGYVEPKQKEWEVEFDEQDKIRLI